MSSFLFKSFATINKPMTRIGRYNNHATTILGRGGQQLLTPRPATAAPAMSSVQQQQQLRSYYHGNSSSTRAAAATKEAAAAADERIWPVYMHHVSKIVLQHLQDSRSNWLIEQGLDSGLHIKSNGTFLLKFPARKGYDAGKIWTTYDASTRQHWLLVYRNKFNAKFLLKKGQRCPKGRDKMLQDNNNNNNNNNSINKVATMEEQIRQAVDQMIRLVPPRLNPTPTTTQKKKQEH